MRWSDCNYGLTEGDQKTCPRCQSAKPWTPEHFPRDARMNGGLAAHCRECDRKAGQRWRSKRPGQGTARSREWQKQRRRSDPAFKIVQTLRSRIRAALCGGKKSARSETLLGCSADAARRHIERQFQPGMSWDNHGDWHIDHIIPLSAFDLRDPTEQRKAFNYRNLQPLWAAENIRKAGKLSASRAEMERALRLAA